MLLPEFYNDFSIGPRRVRAIKNRIWVILPVTPGSSGAAPERYLFTNQTNLSPEYLKCFTAVAPLDYRYFIEIARPAFAERVEEKNTYNRFPTVEYVIPQPGDVLEGCSVVDLYNYFFLLAAINSEQEAFQHVPPGLPQELRELLQRNEQEGGKAIFRQIRTYLETFNSFQPDNHKIVEAFAQLVARCSREKGLPPYASGGALPGGCLERLLALCYAEDPRVRFDVAGLDFSGPWRKLRSDKEGRETFRNVASAFRDTLLGVSAQQYSSLLFRGDKALSKLAQDAIPADLQARFQRARMAFNGLRQILRSKVLLSQILKWVLSSLYQLKDVEQLPDIPENQARRDQAVETAILQRWQENGLARPVRRPSRRERRRFSQLLTRRFKEVIAAILASDSTYPELAAALPGPLRDLVVSVRRDPKKQQLLRAVSGAHLGDELHKAFLEAAQTVLLDVLCPALYRVPVVTTSMLKRFFRTETMAVYLIAVFLGDSSQDAVSKIAEKHLDFFETKIDTESKDILDDDAILRRLLDDFLDVLAAPEIQRRLTEGMRVLRDIHHLLEQTDLERELRGGVGGFVIRPIDGSQGTVAKTPFYREIIKIAARQVAEKKLENRLGQHSHGAACPGSTTPGPGAGSMSEEPEDTADETEERFEESECAESPLDRKIEEILAKAVPDTQDAGDLGSNDKEGLIQQIAEEVMEDEPFVGGLAEDFLAFERTLYLIYSRYIANPDKRNFRNKVDRMTLINLLLRFQHELGLGRLHSNLYELLLDLVLHLDPDHPDPKAYLREKSLTHCFDDADLENGGMTDLRQTLEVQTSWSLTNIKQYVSELWGIKYLMDHAVQNSNAEIVIINTTAAGFLKWVEQDNLVQGQGNNLLQSGPLARQGPDQSAQPGLICLANTAFPDDNQAQWIAGLAAQPMKSQGLSFIWPPMCLSTRALDAHGHWASTGESWAAAAEHAPAPIVIIGPSPRLNPADDGFPTTLPAVYVFATHVISRSEQRLRIKNVARESHERFRIIGFGAAPMEQSLERILWGEGGNDHYAFAVDFYLYIVLTLLATASRYGGPQSLDVDQFFRCFYFEGEDMLDKRAFKSAEILQGALIGNNPLAFGMDQVPVDDDLRSVTYTLGGKSLLDKGSEHRHATQVHWFNVALKMIGLR